MKPVVVLVQLLLCIQISACDDPASMPPEGTRAGDCSDDADNDGDGLFDCADPGCAGASACGTIDAGTDAGPADAGGCCDGGDIGGDTGPEPDAAIDAGPRPDSGPLPGRCADSMVILDTGFEEGEEFPLSGVTEASTDRAHSGSRSLYYRYTGSGKWGAGRSPDFTEAYVDYWAYNVDMPCRSCGPGGKHYFRFMNVDDRVQQIDTEARNGSVKPNWFGFDFPNPGVDGSHPESFYPGTWHRVRVAVRHGAEGRFVWMIDDEVVVDISADMSDSRAFTSFIFTNYDYTSPGDPSGLTPSMYLDDFVFRTGAGAFDCLAP